MSELERADIWMIRKAIREHRQQLQLKLANDETLTNLEARPLDVILDLDRKEIERATRIHDWIRQQLLKR